MQIKNKNLFLPNLLKS